MGHFFLERRGLATGITSTAAAAGGMVFPLVMERLFERVGWAWAIRIQCLICLSLTTAANFLVRSRLPSSPKASAHPDPRIFANRAFACTTAAIFLFEFALFIPLTYVSSYAVAKGFSAAFSYDIVAVLNAGSVVGRLAAGFLSDIFGPYNANIVAVALSIMACLGIWLPAGGTAPGLVAFAVLFGICSGANISLIPVAIGRLCRTQEYGRYYATTYTVVSVACLVGIPAAGKVLSTEGGGYRGLIITTALVYAASLVAFVAAKLVVVGWDKPFARF